MELKREVVQYFGKKGFQRLFALFKDKIETLGTVTGTVKLIPNQEEKEALENWMNLKIADGIITVSLRKFEKRLIGSRFESFTLFEIVEWVTGTKIVPKKEREWDEELKKEAFFERMSNRYHHPNVILLLDKMKRKDKGSSALLSLYKSNDIASIEILFRAVSNLPKEGEFERLPIFSERITGDPHYFDKTKRLYQVIEVLMCEKEKRQYRSQLSAEDETELLSLVNLDKDDLHSFVTCYGLEAYKETEKLMQWHWANEEECVQNIPLRSLRHITSVKPVIGDTVYILENSGVYSSVIDKLNGVYPVVCTHGNFKLAGLLLIDKLVKSGTKVYYSGDIDPKGVSIARYLKKKYSEQVYIWRMGVAEYHQSMSNIDLSEASLGRLKTDEKDLFYAVESQMKLHKKAAYQEPLLKLFVSDITNS